MGQVLQSSTGRTGRVRSNKKQEAVKRPAPQYRRQLCAGTPPRACTAAAGRRQCASVHGPGKLGMSHDQNFKNLVLDYPRAALALFAAAEAATLDAAARIVPVRQEQLQERLGERFRELDIPLLVEWPDGRRAALLFVLEEESDPRRFSIHRLAHYCLDLAELFGTERVVPVVIFLRAAAGAPEALRLGGDQHEYLHFRYLRCALAELDYDAYRDSDNLVARLTLPSMNYPPERRVEVYAQAVRGLTALEPDREKRLKYLDFIDILPGTGGRPQCRGTLTRQPRLTRRGRDHEPICRTLP
jgi:hypothetical protein